MKYKGAKSDLLSLRNAEIPTFWGVNYPLVKAAGGLLYSGSTDGIQ